MIKACRAVRAAQACPHWRSPLRGSVERLYPAKRGAASPPGAESAFPALHACPERSRRAVGAEFTRHSVLAKEGQFRGNTGSVQPESVLVS